MQEKTIKWALKRKTESFVQSLPEYLQEEVRKNLFVAGGAITSLVYGDKPNDYDIYIADPDVLEELANCLIDRFKEQEGNNQIIDVFQDDNTRVRVKVESSGVAEMMGTNWAKNNSNKSDETDYIPTFITENSISLGNADIQIITRFSGSAAEVVNSFDFDHTRNYYILWENKVVWSMDAMKSLLTGTLAYRGSKYPLCALIRTRKFIKRGFKCPVDIYVRIAFELNELDLSNPEVLSDQLVGVDFMYFAVLIRMIEKDMKDNPGLRIDSTYICELLDRLEDRDSEDDTAQLDIMNQEIREGTEEDNGHE